MLATLRVYSVHFLTKYNVNISLYTQNAAVFVLINGWMDG